MKRPKREAGTNSLSCQPRLSPNCGQSRPLFGVQTHSQHPWFHVNKVFFLHTQNFKLFLQSNQTFVNNHPCTSSESLLWQRKYTQPLYICKRPPVDTRAELGEMGRNGKLISCLLNSKEKRHFPQMHRLRSAIPFHVSAPNTLAHCKTGNTRGILLVSSGGEEKRTGGMKCGRGKRKDAHSALEGTRYIP